MFSPKVVFSVVVATLVVEVLIWKIHEPVSFARQFDPVHREDIHFEPSEFDLGNVTPNERQSLAVTVTNLKNRAIVFQQPQSSCGCIRFKLDGPLELAPNETTVLNLDYKAPRAPGEISKNILLRVASANSTWRIPFKCKVVADAWSDPQDLELVTNNNTATENGLLHFTKSNSIGFVICSDPEIMDVQLGTPSSKTQSFDITVRSDFGEGYVAFLDTNANHVLTVPVTWRTPRWMECCPARVTLEPGLSHNESYEIVVLRDSQKTQVPSIESLVPWLNVDRQWSVSEKVERFIIEVDAKAMPKSFQGPIVAVSDSNSGQSVELEGKI